MTFVMPRFPKARETLKRQSLPRFGEARETLTLRKPAFVSGTPCWRCGTGGFDPMRPCRSCGWTISDDERGLVWWARMNEAQREGALRAARTNVPCEAWEYWKQTQP
jgi:hypothetical protein